jgi:tetratricopeptide (TPR) repeat protein
MGSRRTKMPGKSPAPDPSLRFSMESFLSGLGGAGRGRRGAVGRAQEVMYDAWEADDPEKRLALAARALETSPDCADAYVLLAQEAARTLEDAIALYRQGVAAGERALGKKAFREEVGYFWGLIETRPYMRARQGLAEGLWEAGEREEAVGHYRELLRLNPEDNQGIRDLLMPCLIELGRDADAERLYKRYKNDPMAVWRYSRALLDFRRHGAGARAAGSLGEAIAENPYVPDYLLGRRKPPRHLPAFYGFGDRNEAILYAYGNKAAWEASPGALAWLKGQVKAGGCQRARS